MRWNFDESVMREGTDCVKYDLRKQIFGRADIIPMWVADMDFKTPDFILSALRKRLDHEICGYSFRPESYFAAISGWMERRHGWNIDAGWILFCPGIVPALNLCTLAFTGPGDSIIVQPPVYFPFFSAVEAHGRKLLCNRLAEADGRWEMDLEGLVSSIRPDTRMIMISNPHNPVGRAWTREELTALAEICLEKNILIISDEIHSDLVLPGSVHVPVASLSDEIAANTVTLIAPSKTFNLAGLSTSSVIISDRDKRKKFSALTENLHIGNGNIFGNIASTAAYSSGDQWLSELITYIEDNVETVMEYFPRNAACIIPVRPEATYMIWLDCRNLNMSVKEIQEFFVNRAGVGMNEGSAFGPGGEGFMRMNIATTRKTVIKALEQISTAVSGLR